MKLINGQENFQTSNPLRIKGECNLRIWWCQFILQHRLEVFAILSHLANQPQFRFLKQQACYKKYIS
ncbi:MAG TPA: hypothetical protein EYP60_02620, partial [bacterium (Candidatus Stahlbacteria)]|nr:hypothetical protein [Candidatus Stahlbacteria bacterium]